MRTSSGPSFAILLILGAAAAIAPLSLHMFLPALPVVREYFGAPMAVVQLTLSLPQIFIAPAILVYGPLADRHGRRPVLLAGGALFVAGSLVCFAAPSIGLLIAGRVAQQIGVSAAMVIPRAIVTDLSEPEDVARNIAKILLILLIAPTVAPIFGGHIVDWLGWRSVFLVHAVIGAVLLLVLRRLLPESLTSRRPAISLRQLIGDFRSLLRLRAYVGYSLNAGANFAAWLGFVSLAPYLLANMGVDASGYGVWFLITALGAGAGALIASRPSRRWGHDRMILTANLASLAAIAAAGVIAILGFLTPLTLFVPMAFVIGGLSVANPNANAAAVSGARHIAGTASSLIGFFQNAAAALVMVITGFLGAATPYPLLLLMFGGLLLSLTGLRIATTKGSIPPA